MNIDTLDLLSYINPLVFAVFAVKSELFQFRSVHIHITYTILELRVKVLIFYGISEPARSVNVHIVHTAIGLV